MRRPEANTRRPEPSGLIENVGAMKFVVDPVLADVAARSDGDIELRSGAVGDQVARPMIVVASRRKIEDFFAGAFKMGVAVAVRKTPNAVGVSDIEIAVEQEHAERLVQAGRKNKALLGNTGLAHVA